MLKIAILSLLMLVGGLNAASQPVARIMGGTITTIDAFPFVTSLLRSADFVNYVQTCAGSILTQRAVLSAAHCFAGEQPSRWRIRAGSSWANSRGTVYTISQIVMHPNYNSRTYDSDIAIVKSASNIALVGPVKVGSIAGANYKLADNQAVWAVGWGTTYPYTKFTGCCIKHHANLTVNLIVYGLCKVEFYRTHASPENSEISLCDKVTIVPFQASPLSSQTVIYHQFGGPKSEQLRRVQIWSVNQNLCRSRYAELGRTVTGNMLCSGWIDVGGRDQCQDDAGGPLLHNNIIVGVASWGQQCGLARYPGVNTRVSNFTSWIRRNA